MNATLDRYVKDLMDEYPGMAAILDEFGIGCASCSVGTCKLRDIIEIHGLSEEREQALFQRIAQIVFPGETVSIPRLPRKNTQGGTSGKFSPPLRMLVNEHENIKKVISAIPSIIDSAQKDLEHSRPAIEGALDFIRNYADKFHHAKEENILFKLFNESVDIISAMKTEHETGRGFVRAAAAALEKSDVTTVAGSLTSYAELLSEHIRKEDEVLYPWMDRNMTDSQIGILYSRFVDVETGFGSEPKRLVNFADSIVTHS